MSSWRYLWGSQERSFGQLEYRSMAGNLQEMALGGGCCPSMNSNQTTPQKISFKLKAITYLVATALRHGLNKPDCLLVAPSIYWTFRSKHLGATRTRKGVGARGADGTTHGEHTVGGEGITM